MQRQQQNVRRGDTEDVPRSRGRDSSWSGGYSRLYDEGEPPNKRRMGMHDDSYNSRSTGKKEKMSPHFDFPALFCLYYYINLRYHQCCGITQHTYTMHIIWKINLVLQRI